MASKIEWTNETWNPVVGCTRASRGCDNCYAVRMSHRLENMGQSKYSGLTVVNGRGDRHFNGQVRCVEADLQIPLRWKKPRRCFVNSMSDLFHRDVPFEFIDKVFAIMALCPQHTFQILTKRPERMAEYMATLTPERLDAIVMQFLNNTQVEPPWTYVCRVQEHIGKLHGWPLPNVWLGTSCEDQAAADERIPHLLRCPAAVRFLSCEPLLGPIDFRIVPGFNRVGSAGQEVLRNLWVIAGGESGPGARPMHPDWARSLRDQCQAARVPFFFKQWGEWRSPLDGERWNTMLGRAGKPPSFLVAKDGTVHCTCEGAEGSGDCAAQPMVMVGKHKAGRILDGRTWDEYPEATRG